MDGGNGLGNGDELVVGGDGTLPHRRPRSARRRRRCARRRPGRAWQAGHPAVRRSGPTRRVAAVSAAPPRPAPADRPRSRRRPAAPTSSDPAISTGCVSGTGRPSRTARQAAYTRNAMASCHPRRRTPSDTRSPRVLSPPPAGSGASTNRTDVPAARGEQGRGQHGVVIVVEPLVGGEVGAADRHDVAAPPRASGHEREVAAAEARRVAAAGVVALREAAVDLLHPVERRRSCRSRARGRRHRQAGRRTPPG